MRQVPKVVDGDAETRWAHGPRHVAARGQLPGLCNLGFTAALTQAYSTAWTGLANGCTRSTEQQNARKHLVDYYQHSQTKSSGSLGSGVHVDAPQHK
jgi:hypothetical protein